MPGRRAAVSLILAAAAWGFGTVVAKRAVSEVPAFTLLAIQLGSSVLVLGGLMRWRGLPLRDRSTPAILGRLGLLNPGAAYGLSLLGLSSITVSLSVLLWALEPLLILVLAAILLRERVGLDVLFLSGVAIAALVAVAQPALSASTLGVLLTIAGVVCCAVYTIVVRSSIAGSDSTAQVVLAQQVYALGLALAMLLTLGLLGRDPGIAGLTSGGLASAVLSGVLYYAVAYWFYLTGLRQVPASIASASFYLVPVFGVAGGFAFLGDSLAGGQWLG
ncbi:MAG TPA: DMT family transporter, partial [Candidatus Limnocylindrales bacterium]|nr:DMT family transporter [Candidatus Limnocylindrales bacterium]